MELGISDMQLKRDADPYHIGSYQGGDVAWIIVAGVLVSFMIPGLGFLYSGLARRKSALSLIWACSAANAVCIFQWWFWGYSLAFSHTGTSGFIGNLSNIGLRNVGGDPSPGTPLLPEILYAFFQMEFAAVTVAILMGGLAERGRVFPAMVFAFCWLTIVYCPIANWVWGVGGWAFKWSVLDFAGGGPVEIASGVSGLAYAWVLGKRTEKELLNFRPHNVSLVNLGTFILWFGWLGFNGGSAFDQFVIGCDRAESLKGANIRAITAIWNSMLAAAMGGMTWCALDWRLERKWTMVGFCSGTIAGLVAATPASGYIPTWAAVIMGVVVGVVANFATKIKFYLRIDDALDLFAEHAMGGIVGLIFNGFFATSQVISLDGVSTSVEGGWLDGNWKQMYKQIAYIAAVCTYSFVVTAALAHIVNRIPGLALRASAEDEQLGMDDAQIGEFANDYVEVRRDFTDWTPEPGGGKSASRWDSEDGPTTHVGTVNSRSGSAHGGMTAGDRHGVPDRGPDEHEHGRATHRGRPLQPETEKHRAPNATESSGTSGLIAGDRHGGGPDIEKQG